MKKLLTGLFAILMIVSCGKSSESLRGKSFVTETANGTKITLNFDATENRISGKVVNNFFGPYEIDGNNIKFGMIGSTMMMGPEDAMKAEYEFFQVLSKVDSYSVEGKKLFLKTPDGSLEFTLVE